jgi:hypothetical protein
LAKYRLKFERLGNAKGTIVYDCHKHDYGCVSDDERMTGLPHIAVTQNEDGDYPFFTVATQELELING